MKKHYDLIRCLTITRAFIVWPVGKKKTVLKQINVLLLAIKCQLMVLGTLIATSVCSAETAFGKTAAIT